MKIKIIREENEKGVKAKGRKVGRKRRSKLKEMEAGDDKEEGMKMKEVDGMRCQMVEFRECQW